MTTHSANIDGDIQPPLKKRKIYVQKKTIAVLTKKLTKANKKTIDYLNKSQRATQQRMSAFESENMELRKQISDLRQVVMAQKPKKNAKTTFKLNAMKGIEYLNHILLTLNSMTVGGGSSVYKIENDSELIKLNDRDERWFYINTYVKKKKGFGNIIMDIKNICDNDELKNDKLFESYEEVEMGKNSLVKVTVANNYGFVPHFFDDPALMTAIKLEEHSKTFVTMEKNGFCLYLFAYDSKDGKQTMRMLTPEKLGGTFNKQTIRFVGALFGKQLSICNDLHD